MEVGGVGRGGGVAGRQYSMRFLEPESSFHICVSSSLYLITATVSGIQTKNKQNNTHTHKNKQKKPKQTKTHTSPETLRGFGGIFLSEMLVPKRRFKLKCLGISSLLLTVSVNKHPDILYSVLKTTGIVLMFPL